MSAGDRVDLDQIEARAGAWDKGLTWGDAFSAGQRSKDFRYLLAEVRRLRAALETAQELVNELDCWCDEHEPVCIGHQLRAVLAADETEQR